MQVVGSNRAIRPPPNNAKRVNEHANCVSVCLCSARQNEILLQIPYDPEMSNRLPSLEGAGAQLLALLAACIASLFWAAEISAAEPRSGQTLIGDAAEQLHQGPPLEARVGCRVRLFGQELTATGSYVQFGGGTGKTRLVLAMAAGGKVFRKQMQITDGLRHLYIREENRGVKSLISIDLRKVSRAMSESDGDQTPPLQLTAVGGVPRLLAQLNTNFDFGTPIESHLGNAKNEIPVLIVPGKWKPEMLAKLLPEHQQEILAGKPAPLDKLASHLPHEVEVTLGNDDKFPLFPYKVVFLRYASDAEDNPRSRSDNMAEILSLKLFEVKHRPQLSREFFDYRPQNNKDDVASITDGTAQYIKRLGLKPAEPKK